MKCTQSPNLACAECTVWLKLCRYDSRYETLFCLYSSYLTIGWLTVVAMITPVFLYKRDTTRLDPSNASVWSDVRRHS